MTIKYFRVCGILLVLGILFVLIGCGEEGTATTEGNHAPSVNAGTDQTIMHLETADLSGTVSDDGLPVSETVTVAWSVVSGPGIVTFGDDSSAETTADFSLVGTYVLRLSADDSELQAYDEVTINVAEFSIENQAPVVDAGDDHAINFLTVTVLSGSIVDDGYPAPPGAVTAVWTMVSGPGTVTFGDDLSVHTTAEFSMEGTYVLRLTGDDSDLQSSDDVTVSVSSNGGAVTEYRPALVDIIGGTFAMGDSKDEGETNEKPVHSVTLTDFAMANTEVTNAQYAAVMNWAYAQGDLLDFVNATTVRAGDYELLNMDSSRCHIDWDGSTFIAEENYKDHPVVELTWYGAMAYCAFLSELEGIDSAVTIGAWNIPWVIDLNQPGYRLPTEAEWEFAARADLAGKSYPWGDAAFDGSQANHKNTATAVVASYPAYGGLYDMSGNVWEFCYDWYGSYSSGSETNPTGASTGTYRVNRGASFGHSGSIRCAFRNRLAPKYGSSRAIGFRPARGQTVASGNN